MRSLTSGTARDSSCKWFSLKFFLFFLKLFLLSNSDLFGLFRFGVFQVEKFAFDLCVRGFGTWRERALMLEDLRSKMPAGFSVYMSESPIMASIVSSRSAVLKSVVVTVICMALICLFFLPTLHAAACATVSVASITIG